MIEIRRAVEQDAGALAELLNEIVDQGGTTARTLRITESEILSMMAFEPAKSAWHVALKSDDHLGYQYIKPQEYLPPEACDIATFVQVGNTGLGIGSALFDATLKAANEMGYEWINANIRADNHGGLSYYDGRGFNDYDRIRNFTLDSGQVVDKILKRKDL